MELHFGKFKGYTVEQVAKTEEGRKWLQWWVEKGLDVNDPKWGKRNAETKEKVMKIWRECEPKPETTPTPEPTIHVPSNTTTPAQILVELKKMNLQMVTMDKKIESIIALMAGDKPETPEAIAWEE